MIEVQGLSKDIRGRALVRDVSLAIAPGTVFGFLGQNGAGKTTTIKMLVGLNRPTRGQITIGGRAPTEASVRERIGFMPETPYFYEHLSGAEFLRLCGALFLPTKKTPDQGELLQLVGLYEARGDAVSTYSKGMKQRLGFAQALVNDPDYIFLDEPLDGLDPLGRLALKRIIRDLKAAGKTIFFNSHILFDTEELCDSIGILHQGSLVYAGPLAAFTQGKPLEAQFVSMIESLTLSL